MGQTFSRIPKFFSSKTKETPALVCDEETVCTVPLDLAFLPLPTYPLATPRRPLHHTKRPVSPLLVLPEEPVAKRLKGEFQYLNFAFLKDDLTINFVQISKVMFIMKGLPGSGKSFISQLIQEIYWDTTVCSADHYFMQHSLRYQYDKETLQDAHDYCQQQAANAAKQHTHVVVIDNNNLKLWEMQFYLTLASTHSYIPVVVEPQTPWAMVPSELAVKNAHNIPEKIITEKVKLYQPLQPIYYGWFLNEADSEEICSIGMSWLRRALGVEDFLQEFLEVFQVNSSEGLLSLFTQDFLVRGGHILHATSKFTARGKVKGAKEYITNPLVKQAVGKSFRLGIIGFVITTRTIGARLKLTEEQLQLWSGNDNEEPPVIVPSSGVMKEDKQKQSDSQGKNKMKYFTCRNTSVCVPTVTVTETCSTDRFHPTSGKGSRTHITLACAPGIQPVNTGFDLIRAVRCEQRALKCNDQKVETYTLDGGVLRNYGEGVWVVYPKCKVLVSSLFSAFY